MSADRDFVAIDRRMRIEAGAGGALIALNTAFVSLLLISRGAEAFALGIYVSGASLLGLGAGVLGPIVAARTRKTARVTLGALMAARIVFVIVALCLAFTPDGALPLLIAALLLWSVGEGMALPLWTAYLASLSHAAERGRWFANRGTAAAVGAAATLLPMLVLVRLTSTDRSLQAAYLVAALAAAVSTLQVRTLFRLAPAPMPSPPHPRLVSVGPERWFLGGVFTFWFGAALNRPVLPPYVVHELHAPAGYFAVAAVVAAVAGVGLQRWWGEYGSTSGSRALLALSGIGAGVSPLLWTAVPDYRFGIPLEAFAAGCWLGHLLGITLHAVEQAQDDAERAGVIAQIQVTQGIAAGLAPLGAVALVGFLGTPPILVTSGLICLLATAIMTKAKLLATAVPASGRLLHRWYNRLTQNDGNALEPGGEVPEWNSTRANESPYCHGRVRARLPVALKRALSADCPSCRGLGCKMCYGVGLG